MDSDHPALELIDQPAAADSAHVLSDADAIELMRSARRIAVIGASSLPWRASNSVMHFLLDHGYECVPVTPKRHEVLGHACYDTLEAAVAATGPFDIVDVFRRPEYTPEIARSAVATGCKALWLQQGVISPRPRVSRTRAALTWSWTGARRWCTATFACSTPHWTTPQHTKVHQVACTMVLQHVPAAARTMQTSSMSLPRKESPCAPTPWSEPSPSLRP